MTGYVRLPILEEVVLWIIAFFMWLYPVYRLYIFTSVNRQLLSGLCVESAWMGSEWQTDSFDYTLYILVVRCLPVRILSAVLQLIIGEILRQKQLHQRWLAPAQFAISSIYLLAVLGVSLTLFQLALTLVMYLCSIRGYRMVVWIVAVATFFSYSSLVTYIYQPAENETMLETVFTQGLSATILSWRLCHMVIFACDYSADKHQPNIHSLNTYLAYIFYCPTLNGPILLFRDYMKCLQDNPTPAHSLTKRTLSLTLNSIRLVSLYVLIETFNHTIPIRSVVASLPSSDLLPGRWELLGVSIWAGIYFNLVYMVAYGVGCQLAKFEGVEPPQEPRFVLWISNYSEMWKHFDHGMYLFIRDYLYRHLSGDVRDNRNGKYQSIHTASQEKPTSQIRRIFASMAIFGYVYFWHGRSTVILHWTLINFVMVSLEQFGRSIGRHANFQRLIGRTVGHSKLGLRRLQALSSSPLYICSIVGQIGFLTSSEWLGTWALISCWTAPLWLWVVFVPLVYCNCQAIIDVKHWRKLDPPRKIDKSS